MSILKPVEEALKSFIFKHTKLGAPRYPYNVEPIQLATIIMELERLKNVEGNIAEIGLARGMTSRFICEHIKDLKLSKDFTYFAIDTFESFTEEDLKYEVENRGKSLFELKGFDYNDFNVWQSNFAKFPFVKVVKGDCALLDYSKLAPLKLTFLDVDLYLPTKNALPRIYSATLKGGIILVDDVCPDVKYDGAYQAYIEFCKEHSIEVNVIGNKCGVIYKP